MKHLLTFSILIYSLCSIEAQTLGSWNCLDFNGTTSQVVVPNQPSLNPSTAVTVEAWISADVWATSIFQGSIVAHDTWGTQSEGWALRTGANGSLSFVIALNNNGSWYEAQSTPQMLTNKWYHVAGTYDGTTVRIYINGKQVGTWTQAGTITTSNVDMKIGNFPGPGSNRYFDGKIDEVRVWNTALSQNTIKEYMCQYINPNHPNYSGLLAYYNFDLAAGSIVNDLSGNANDGLISGATWGASGAALGDESAFLYPTGWTGKDLSLSHANGDSMNVSGVTGNPDGIHLYRVDNHPNYQTTPPGVIQFLDNRYWGVYLVGGTNPHYNLKYNYAGYQYNGAKTDLNLNYRTDNSDMTWDGLTTINDTIQTTLLKSTASQGEFILGTNDVLTDFNLVSPVHSTIVTLQGNASQTIPFIWNSSSVGGTSSPKYKCHIDYDTSSFNSPLRSYQSSGSGVDTTKAVTYQDMASLMMQLKLEYGDTLHARWTAEALTGPLARFANAPFDIDIVRDVISTDAIYLFFINLPVNDDTLKAVEDGTDLEIFNWSRAKSSIGNELTYEIQIAGHSGNFNNPIAVFPSDNNGTDTLVSISHADLATILKGLNLQSGQVFRFKWRAKAEIASLQSYSIDSQYVYMYWEESPFIGIEERSEMGLRVYPNPVEGDLVLHCGMPSVWPSDIELLDNTGKKFRSWRLVLEKETKLPLGKLPVGTYLLRITTGDNQSIQRVLIK